MPFAAAVVSPRHAIIFRRHFDDAIFSLFSPRLLCCRHCFFSFFQFAATAAAAMPLIRFTFSRRRRWLLFSMPDSRHAIAAAQRRCC
jgi:hypothetical protein